MKTELQLKIINIIREYRNDNELSQAALADVLGISYGMMGNIESIKYSHKYSINQLYKLSVFFNIPFERLFLSEEEVNKSKRAVINLLILKIAEYDGQTKNHQ